MEGACSVAKRQEGRGGVGAQVGGSGKKQVGRLERGHRVGYPARQKGEVRSG